MRVPIALLIAASFALAACGKSNDASKASAPLPTPPAVKADAKAEAAKADEKPHAAESHGMPGMADLFKGDEKKDEAKKDEPKK